jgi:hypothetical protein
MYLTLKLDVASNVPIRILIHNLKAISEIMPTYFPYAYILKQLEC